MGPPAGARPTWDISGIRSAGKANHISSLIVAARQIRALALVVTTDRASHLKAHGLQPTAVTEDQPETTGPPQDG